MGIESILSNALNPPVLFFFLGMAAVLLKSDLELPPPLPKLFSLYLLIVIGFKGGVELHHGGLSPAVVSTFFASIIAAAVVPIGSFFVLRLKMDVYNSAAIAAAYGSVSAVTFVTASAFLQQQSIPYSGYMVASLALMESPAIIAGVVMVRLFSKTEEKVSWSEILREAFLNGSVFLLVGSLLIGLVSSEVGEKSLEPFTKGIFYGALCFFLLDMGLVAARRIRDISKAGTFLVAFGILTPIVNATIAILIAHFIIGMPEGNALLFAVLCASASYIAVPAAMRMSIPEANPSIYVSMALAITFPFNIIVGIPLYLNLIRLLGA